MANIVKNTAYRALRWSEQYTKTDMVYLVHGSSWTGMGQVVAALAAFATAVAFANLLPPSDYGTYKYVLSVMAVLTVSTLPELSTAVLQATARGSSGILFPAMMARLRYGGFGLLIGIGIAIYYALKGNAELSTLFAISAVAVPFIETLATPQSVLLGKRMFKEAAWYTSITAAASAGGVILTLLLTDQIWIILAVYIASTSVSRLFRFRQVSRIAQKEPVDTEALRFGMHLSFSVAIAGIAANADSIILWHMTNPEMVALYAFAVAAITPARTFLKSAVNLAHPKMAVADKQVIHRTLTRRVVRSWLFLLPLITAFVVIIPFFFDIFFPVYREAAVYAQVMAVGLIFTPNKLFSIALVARQNKSVMYTLNAINSTVRVLLFSTLIFFFGLWGAVAATLVSQAFSGVTTFLMFKRTL